MTPSPTLGPEPEVFLHVLPSTIKAAAYCGVDIVSMAQAQGQISTSADPSTSKMPVGLLFDLFNQATRLSWQASHGKHFPLALGYAFSFDYLSDFSSFITTSATLRAASEVLQWLPPFICPVLKWRITEDAQAVRIGIDFDEGYQDPLRTWAVTEGICAVGHLMVKHLVGHDNALVEVHFKHPPHVRAHECERYFGCRVHFSAAHNVFVINRAAFDRPLTSHLKPLNDLSRQKILALVLGMDGPDQDTVPSAGPTPSVGSHWLVKRAVDIYSQQPALLGQGIEALCLALNMPRRTLQRRLATIGTSHRDLVNNIRQSFARQLLKNQALSLDEVARTLGYPDRRALNAAFKGWTGLSPRQWREQSR